MRINSIDGLSARKFLRVLTFSALLEAGRISKMSPMLIESASTRVILSKTKFSAAENFIKTTLIFHSSFSRQKADDWGLAN